MDQAEINLKDQVRNEFHQIITREFQLFRNQDFPAFDEENMEKFSLMLLSLKEKIDELLII